MSVAFAKLNNGGGVRNRRVVVGGVIMAPMYVSNDGRPLWTADKSSLHR